MRFLFCLLAVVIGCEKPSTEVSVAGDAGQTAEQRQERPKGYIDEANDDLRKLKVDLNEQAGAREGNLDEKIGQGQ